MLYPDCMSQRGLASCLHQWKHDIYISAQAFASALTHRQLPFMDQFTCTVCLDLATCFRAWGYWMLERKVGETTDDESDSTDDESEAASYEGNDYPLGWGRLPTIEEDVIFAENESLVASPPHKFMSSTVCNARDKDEVQPDATDAACNQICAGGG